MKISRPCYDKYHRCPGWAGGGMRRAKIRRCDGGYIPYPQKRAWAWWYVNRCPECGMVILPFMIRWLDWRWITWKVPFEVRDWVWERRNRLPWTGNGEKALADARAFLLC